MVQINFAQKTVNVKVVYYGPGMSGKTTNLEVVHQRAPASNRGELTSISTDGDRTLFFDYMPLELGTVAGMRTCFQVYTVPGQVYYNSTRKLVLQGVDGVIFIADSSAAMLDQNLESLRNLEENLNEYGKSLASMPHVIQWNKRDLPDAMSVEELERHLNHHGAETFEGIANTGQGVFPTLKAMAAVVLKSIIRETSGAQAGAAPSPVPSAAPSRAPVEPVVGQPAVGGPAAGEPVPLHTPPVAPPTPAAAPLAAAAHLPETAPAPAPPSAPQVAPTVAVQAVAAPVVATPVAAPVAPSPSESPGEVMRHVPVTAPPPQPRPRARSVPVAGAAARHARTGHANTPVVAVPRRKGALFTGAFVLLAAGAGAALAWVVLTML
jgi:mutual gliding-motility protein MglA